MYKVHIVYVNGESETITVKSQTDPFIDCDYGTYRLQTSEGKIHGVVRVKILEKKNIKCE